MTAAEFITRLGGPAAVSQALGGKVSPTAVAMWKMRGSLPREWHMDLWHAAVDRGVAWAPPRGEELLGKVLLARMAAGKVAA